MFRGVVGKEASTSGSGEKYESVNLLTLPLFLLTLLPDSAKLGALILNVG